MFKFMSISLVLMVLTLASFTVQSLNTDTQSNVQTILLAGNK